MLIVTLIIASLTLIERKFLGLVQRRVGPNFVGYHGRLQYIADALKLFLKETIIPEYSNKNSFFLLLFLVTTLSYLFWCNSVWGPYLTVLDIEYNVIWSILFSSLFSIFIILTGFFTKNKYALMASIRCVILTLNLEIMLGLFFLITTLYAESLTFSTYVSIQESIWLIVPLINISGIIILIFLLEVNRAPFDLTEAESELVSGYNVELGAFYFGIYYLAEYFHLFFFSLTISVMLLGGWNTECFFFFNITEK